jgi:phospholipid/cholesterol/gamma-HCH transport system substrate-binding protein
METRSNYVMVGTVTVALLVGVLLFIVWLAGLSNKATKCYDIYFAQGVGGLNKGSNVSFSGVPVGQITKISLLPNRPEFVWVRVEVDEQTPVLQGTTAQIKGVGFTGARRSASQVRRVARSFHPAPAASARCSIARPSWWSGCSG